jgi:hypothetical protein
MSKSTTQPPSKTAPAPPSIHATRRAIAAEFTRKAVAHYLDAYQHCRDAAERTGGDGDLDFFVTLAEREEANARNHLVRTLLAWRPVHWTYAADAENRYYPPTGVVLDGVAYLAVPNPEILFAKEGEDATGIDTPVMILAVVPLADLVRLDGGAPAGLIDLDPEGVTVEDAPLNPIRAARGPSHRRAGDPPAAAPIEPDVLS